MESIWWQGAPRRTFWQRRTTDTSSPSSYFVGLPFKDKVRYFSPKPESGRRTSSEHHLPSLLLSRETSTLHSTNLLRVADGRLWLPSRRRPPPRARVGVVVTFLLVPCVPVGPSPAPPSEEEEESHGTIIGARALGIGVQDNIKWCWRITR